MLYFVLGSASYMSCRGSDVMIFVVRYPWFDPLRPVDVYIVNHFGGRGTPVLRIGRTSQSGRGCDGHSKRSWGWVGLRFIVHSVMLSRTCISIIIDTF